MGVLQLFGGYQADGSAEGDYTVVFSRAPKALRFGMVIQVRTHSPK